MNFLLKVLPTILSILLIVLIFFGGKKLVTFMNENQESYEAYLVTKNAELEAESGAYIEEGADLDVNFDEADLEDDLTENDLDADLDDDFEDIDLDDPEVALDAELEGKSSNQLIAEASKTVSKKATEVGAKVKSKMNPEAITKKSGVKKTNEKPRAEKQIVSKDLPESYNAKSGVGQYLVIAGSFKSKENAHIWIDALEDKGLKDIEIIEIKSKNLNRVCVSRHTSMETAMAVAKQLRKEHNLDAYVHTKTN